MKLKTLIRIYRELNEKVFANLLTEPRFFALRWRNAHGQHWHNGRYSIMEFNPKHIKGITHATAIVYHEMIHQYVDEYLGLEESDHHGPIFWRNYKLFAPEGIELGECL